MLISNPLNPLTTPKSFLERIKNRLTNDLRHYYRKRIQKQILPLLPKDEANQEGSTLHMLVCERDHEMAIITAGVFNYLTRKAHRFVFHDDGTLSERAISKFKEYLPGTRVISREQADLVAEEMLKKFPAILAYRRKQIMAIKIIDVLLWSHGPRIGYIDSDVLFLKYPGDFMDALEKQDSLNLFNRDIEDAYVSRTEAITSAVGFSPAPRINAGLWVMNRKDLLLEQIENWLGHPFFTPYKSDYRLDQTFIAMLAQMSSSGVAHFPSDYDVNFKKDVASSTCKHYVGRIRYGYELEGLQYLLDQEIMTASDWDKR